MTKDNKRGTKNSMIKFHLCLCLCTIMFISYINNTKAQNLFVKTFGSGSLVSNEAFRSITKTSDGGNVIIGRKLYGILLIKTDYKNDTAWTRWYGYNTGNYNEYEPYDIKETSDTGLIILGYVVGPGSVILLMKINRNGDILWQKYYRDPSLNSINGYSIIETIDKGFLISGSASAVGGIYLIKTDINGNISWTKGYYGSNWPEKIIQMEDTSYILIGAAQNAGKDDILLMKLKKNGDTLWTKLYGGANIESPGSFIQTSDNGFILCGLTTSFGVGGGGDIYLIKTDFIGNLLWSKTYGSNIADKGYTIVEDSLKNFFIGGSLGGRGIIIKTDFDGNVIWAKNKDGSIHTILYNGMNNFIVAGNFSPGKFMLMNMDSLGNGGCNSISTNITGNNAPTTVSYYKPMLVNLVLNSYTQGISKIIGDTISIPCILSTNGIEQSINTTGAISIFPSPACERININYNFDPYTSLTIYNSIGEIIFKIPKTNEKQTEISIDVSEYAEGIYYVLIDSVEGIISKKFIVIKK